MFQKLLNSLFGKWYRPFIFIVGVHFFQFLFIFIFTIFKPIDKTSDTIELIFFFSIIALFVLLGIIHIFKSNKKIKEIIFVFGWSIVLYFSFIMTSSDISKAKFSGNKYYVINNFENRCIKASSGLDLKNKMYKLINETKNITYYNNVIRVVSPTSDLLQENNVPYLYLTEFNNRFPYACFWDKIENKPKYLISKSEKTFGYFSGYQTLVNQKFIYDKEILLALKKDKNSSSENETKKITTKQPTKEDFIKGAKDSLRKILRSYASKSISDEQFEKLMEKYQIETCNISSISYDEELNVYKAKSSCSIKNSKKDINNNVYLTYINNQWIVPDNDILYCMSAKEKNKLSEWKNYIQKFPNGKCKKSAEKRIKELTPINPLVFSIKTEHYIGSFKISNNEKLIAVSHNKQIDIYNIDKKKIILTIKNDLNKPKLSFNKKDDILFVSANDKQGKLYSLSNGKEINLKYKLPKKVGFIFDNTLIFQYSSDYEVKSKNKKLYIGQYDINTGKKIREKKFLENKSQKIEEFRFSPNGRYLVIGLDDKKDSILLWDNKSWKMLWKKTINSIDYIDFNFTADSNNLIHRSLDEDNYKILNTNTGKLTKKIKYISNFTLNNNLDKYLNASYGDNIYLSDAKTNKIIQPIYIKESIEFSDKIELSFKNTDNLMIGKYNNRIYFWREVIK